MDRSFRRTFVQAVFWAVVAAGLAVALASAGLSQSYAIGAAAGVWLALSLVLFGPGIRLFTR